MYFFNLKFITSPHIIYPIKSNIMHEIALINNNLLDSDYPVTTTLKGSKLFYRIDLKSKQMFEDLQRLGVEPNKSLTCTFPNINKDLMPHFIRGLFDGDGCV